MTWRNVRPHGAQEIRHGYTLDDVHRLASQAVWRDRWYRAMDVTDRMEATWFAIVEHLLTCETAPAPYDLIGVGMRASDHLVRDNARTHGRPTNDFWAGDEAMPNFQRYWWTAVRAVPSPEGKVVERLTLAQIMPLLTPRQREVVTLLAATGDHEQAAQALGMSRAAFSVQLSNARRRFFQLWHEGEVPSRQWRTDRRVRSRNGRDHLGRQRLTVSQVEVVRRRNQGGETLVALAPEFGVSSHCLSELLRGKSKPAPDLAAAP